MISYVVLARIFVGYDLQGLQLCANQRTCARVKNYIIFLTIDASRVVACVLIQNNHRNLPRFMSWTGITKHIQNLQHLREKLLSVKPKIALPVIAVSVFVPVFLIVPYAFDDDADHKEESSSPLEHNQSTVESEKTSIPLIDIEVDTLSAQPQYAMLESNQALDESAPVSTISYKSPTSDLPVAAPQTNVSAEQSNEAVDSEELEPSAESDFELESVQTESAIVFPEGLILDWSTTEIRRNDTLSKVFKRSGIKLPVLNKMLAMPGAEMMKTVYPKDKLTVARVGHGQVVGIEFSRAKKGSVMFVINGDDVQLVETAVAKQAGSLEGLFDGHHRALAQEKLQKFEETVATAKADISKWHDVKVKKGDTLARIFKRIGLSDALAVANAPADNWLSSGLMPNQELRIAVGSDGTFSMIEVPDYKSEKVRMVVADGENYAVGFRKLIADIREFQGCATVHNNLYSAAKLQAISARVVDEFVQLYASRIDFSRQLQKGDRFCVVYERKYIKEKLIGGVNIVAASLEQKTHHTKAFRLVDERGIKRYYDEHGQNMEGQFLKAPLKSPRVTSGFSKSRFHPVTKKYRPHKGVDYGAPRNTPIIVTADGIVTKREYHPNGYGRVVYVKHGSKYLTVYAHMNKFAKNTSVGSYVKRGQVIGYVGSTGLSTGNHLHYEFRVNGVHRDPLNYPMPNGKPVPEELQTEFFQQVAILSDKLEGVSGTQIASASSVLGE